MTGKDHLKNKARLAEVVLNKKDTVSIAGENFGIGALSYYTKWMISDLITKMELEDDNIVTLVQAMSVNIPVMAEILALAILNSREQIESDALDELKFKILDSTNGVEWANALQVIFSKLDTGFFFGLTEMVKGLNSMNNKAGFLSGQAEKAHMEDGYQPIQNMVK